MIDAGNISAWELILLGERPPAIPAIEKFVGQAELELRMVSQIADLVDLQSLRRRSLHDQRVGIVETKLARHADAKFREPSAQICRGGCRRCLEDFFTDRAGVFGIESYLISPQRFPKNDGPAHALTVFRRNPGVLDRAFRDFRQDVRFRELFRADENWLRARRG